MIDRELSNLKINSVIEPQNPKNRAETYIFTIICWFLTLCIWVVIISIIYLYIPDPEITVDNFYKYFHIYPIKQILKIVIKYGGVLIYVVYFILEMCSPTYTFLRKKKKLKITEQMNLIFKARPTYCFKFKKINLNEEDNSNFSSKYYFNYYSCRDVSGLFVLNTNKKNINKKLFIMLELIKEIRFARDNSKSDYEKEKLKFKDERIVNNNIKDFKFKEEINIDDIEKYYMIKLGNKDCFFINSFWFFIFTLLSFAEIYKLFLNYKCIYQTFTVRKLVSNRNDLSKTNTLNIYNPELNLINQNYSIPFDIFNYTSNSFQKYEISSFPKEDENKINLPKDVIPPPPVNSYSNQKNPYQLKNYQKPNKISNHFQYEEQKSSTTEQRTYT